MILARTAAMAFNRFADKIIDAKNERTNLREIPSGVIKPNHALWLVIFCSVAFVLICWFINPLVFQLSPIALLVVLGYSYTKRFTSLSHLVLGLGLSLAPLGSYLVVNPHFHLLPLLLSGAVLTWVAGFDVIYAMQDADFDKENKLHSLPTSFGKKNALLISSFLHLISIGFMACFYWMGGFGNWFIIGLIIFSALLIYQHTLVKAHDLSKVNLAFFTLNGIASIVFAVFVLLDFYFHF